MINAIYTKTLSDDLAEIRIVYDRKTKTFKIIPNAWHIGEGITFAGCLKILGELSTQPDFIYFMLNKIFKDYEKKLKKQRK